MTDQLVLRIEIFVEYEPEPNEPWSGRILWMGETGGPIRRADFNDGRTLTQLSPALEQTLAKFQTMLDLQGDPEGWVRKQVELMEPYSAKTDPATEEMVARLIGLNRSVGALTDGRWDGETEADHHQRLFGCSIANCQLCRPTVVAEETCGGRHRGCVGCGLCARPEVA